MVNTLAHSLEVAHQAGIIIAMTGGDKKLVKRFRAKASLNLKKQGLLNFKFDF